MNLETAMVARSSMSSTTVEISMNLETGAEVTLKMNIYDSRNFNELGNERTLAQIRKIYDSRNFNELGNAAMMKLKTDHLRQ